MLTSTLQEEKNEIVLKRKRREIGNVNQFGAVSFRRKRTDCKEGRKKNSSKLISFLYNKNRNHQNVF